MRTIRGMKALIFSAALLWLGLGLYFGYKVILEETAPTPATSSAQPSMMAAQAPSTPALDPKILEEYRSGAVKNTIVKNRQSLVKCYNAYTATKPKQLNGAIVVDWVIQDQGEVSRLGIVRDGLANPALSKCVQDAMKTWLFPPIPGTRPVYVEHTFNFGEPPKPQVPEMVNVKPKK